mmetsp:Transcript_9794/g.28134  ORF Transcript_9794/g.28134 Transcript_9794/m.28134 type:complete len:238 (-) Transcript_9794:82-795(-)
MSDNLDASTSVSDLKKEIEGMELSAIRQELQNLGLSSTGAAGKQVLLGISAEFTCIHANPCVNALEIIVLDTRFFVYFWCKSMRECPSGLLQDFVDLLFKARMERTSPGGGSSAKPAASTDAATSGQAGSSGDGSSGFRDPFAGGADPFAGGNPFGGLGNPFGGSNSSGSGMMGAMKELLGKVMGNPQAMAVIERAMENPSLVKALDEIQKDPRSLRRHMADPDIARIITELQRLLH